MMRELLTPEQAALWLHERVRGSLQTDSREVRHGDGFIAWPGASRDGRNYVPDALAQGAAACLIERRGAQAFDFTDEAIAMFPDLKAGSGPIAAAYYGHASQQLDVLAVTGTNGKTTTSWWLAQALSALASPIPCGLIGTLGVGRVPPPGAPGEADVVDTGLTTPDPVLLQKTLRRFVDEGLRAVAIEASSIGIEERRLDGTRIRTAIFTNFTQDHLDYHGSMQAYWQAKAALFDWPQLKAAVLNLDDIKGQELAQQLAQRPLDLWTIACRNPAARLQARNLRWDVAGVCFTVCEGDTCLELATPLIGEYNVLNLLGVIAAMRSLGVPLEQAVAACRVLHPAPGRMEMTVVADRPLAVVDYAHTPDALAHALQALRPLAAARGGRLWCVFGCGGDRDAGKRPLMGDVVSRLADQAVVTSDNPRSETPQAIIDQILLGLEGGAGVSVVADRAEAIAQTLARADARDVVLVAGKGHENYQEIAGRRLPFSDRQQVQHAVQARAAAAQELRS